MILEVALLVLAQVPHVDAGSVGPRPIEPRVVDAAPGTDDPADAGALADADVDAGALAATTVPNLTLTATVEPTVATFGEPFDLVITIVRERGVRLQMPGSLPDIDGAPRMETQQGAATEARIVEELDATSASGTGGASDGGVADARGDVRVRETIRIGYLALDTVDLKTPAFSLSTKDGLVVDVPSLTVKVFVPPDPPDAGPAPLGPPRGGGEGGTLSLEPAAGSIAYPVPDARPWIALSALASAGLLYAAARAAARRRRLRAPAVPLVPPPPPRPAHEVALERLEALLASGMLARGETGVFVERLMDEVLRDYLTARFALSAGTRTTRELVKDLLGVSVPGLDIALVETLLVDTDLVKFAKATIAPDRAHAMATRVRALVEATRVSEPKGDA